jgi:hypothetical protein
MVRKHGDTLFTGARNPEVGEPESIKKTLVFSIQRISTQ